MPSSKRIVLVAGEESGDRHAAELAQKLLLKHPSWHLSGMGGKHMTEAGVQLVFNLAQFGATGFTEVIKHAWVIYKAFKSIKDHLKTIQPDLVILVDCPSFNLRIARFAKKRLGLTILYYISPQIWAWKANRIRLIRQCVDKMAVILPFEKKIYEKAKIPVSFVGHPLVERIPEFAELTELRQGLDLPLDKTIVALLPGSRRNEIENHLPIMVNTAKELVKALDIHFVIPVARTLSMSLIQRYFENCPTISVSFISEKALEVLAASHCVVVASGTASLECALMIKPMCIIYKASFLTYLIASKVIRVNYLGLCNLLQNKMIVPEHLQYDATPKELVATIQMLLSDEKARTAQQERLLALKQSLSSKEADCSIEEVVEELL